MKNFSLWCDYIEKDFIEQQFSALIEQKNIKGATSNPTIFHNAFKQDSYKKSIAALTGMAHKDIYEELAISDIKNAAKLLYPLFSKNTQDGWVSIEIDPFLCDDIAKSIAEGKRLFEKIAAPNVMIKVPATQNGYVIMEELFAANIPVNATLIFTPNQVAKILEAFKRAWERSSQTPKLQAVLSIFVSRFDRMCDHALPDEYKNKIGIMNATILYHQIQLHNLSYVRPLFASTGVKSTHIPKDYYICSLLYPNSINTAPLDAINAFECKDGDCIIPSSQEAQQFLRDIEKYICLETVYQELFEQGITAFKDSFEKLLQF